MAKQNILIVDADPESVKVLEVSLKKVGYSVTTARDGVAGLELIGFSIPDLIISDTRLPGLDGFGLCTKLKEDEELSKIPFIFLTADKSIENKIRGLELGVDDYLNKPIFIREILVRVNLAIQRRQKERLERRGTKTKFSGNLQDMGVVDLMQTIDLGHKSGVLHISRSNDDAHIYFRDGQVIDASTRTRTGADAVYRLLVWSEGTFEIEFTNVERSERIRMSTQGLLMEGMRRLDEWGRLQEQLPPLTAVFDIDEKILAERLGEIPDEVNSVLKHFDGRATLLEVVDNGSLGDLEALTLISKLYFEGLITEIHTTPSENSVDPNAYLPEPRDSWMHSKPPMVPSRVVDDAIGPHMSTAAQFPALTGSPTDPPIGQVPVSTTPTPMPDAAVPVSISALVTPEPGSPTAHSIAPEGGPISTPAMPPAVSAPAESADSAAVSVAKDKGSPIKETRTMRSRRFTPDPKKIAEAIDAEVPPPDQSLQEESNPDEPAFFEGEAYRASVVGPRPSYDPEPRRRSKSPSSPGQRAASTASKTTDSARPSGLVEVDKLTHSSIPATHSTSEWPDDPVEVPKSKVPLIAGAVLFLVVAGIGTYWLLSKPSTKATSQDKQAQTESVANQSKTPANPSGIASDKTAQPNSAPVSRPLVQPEAASKAPADTAGNAALPQGTEAAATAGVPAASTDTGAAPSETADTSGTAQTSGGTPSATPQPQGAPPPADSEASSTVASKVSEPGATKSPLPSAPQQKTLTEEDKAEYKKIMDTVDNVGRKKKIELYRKALEINPASDAAAAGLSIELLETKSTRPEALLLAQKAVAINPDNATGWLAIGYIRQLDGAVDEAKDAYKRCAACSGPSDYVRECRRLNR